MSIRISAFRRYLPFSLVICAGLGSLSWLAWTARTRSDIEFLPRMIPAEWIVYPVAAQGMTHPRVELGTTFRCGFKVERPSEAGLLRIAAFHYYKVVLNGQTLEPTVRGKNWKSPDRFQLTNQLRPRQNELAVTVMNTNGPPALWLALEAGGLTLTSSEQWEASLAGAPWRNARLAIRPMEHAAGSPLYAGDSRWSSLRSCWPLLIVFTALSGFGYWFLYSVRTHARPHPGPLPRGEGGPESTDNNHENLASRGERILVFGLVLFWVILFANNLRALPEVFGFDAVAHTQYIGYILERHALPLANEGYETFQPPLYYILCAGLLKVLGLSIHQAGAVLALRIFGMAIGVAHFLIIWSSLRLLFPGQRSEPKWGLALAACLPVVIYISQYVSNEHLAAMLVSASVLLCLRALKGSRASWKQCAGLGLCLGAALLAKSTALICIPLVLVALAWQGMMAGTGERHSLTRRFAESAFKPAMVLAVCLAVSGWHYWRTYVHFGTPLLGVWDPRLGYSYWQDEGYRTSAFYTRFGDSLTQPWFSALRSFGDGIYSTLWGDSLLGGTATFSYRPPWNYELMKMGFWLALVPTAAVVAGAVLALRNFLRRMSPQWFVVLGLGFLALLALLQMSMVAPSWCVVKAFYALCALLPFCACGASGLEFFWQRLPRLRPAVFVGMGLSLLVGCASLWILPSAPGTVLAAAGSLRNQGRHAEAVRLLERGVAGGSATPEVRLELSSALMRVGSRKAALEQARIAVTELPEDGGARMVLAYALAAENLSGDAVQQARKAVELGPGNGEAYSLLTTLLLEHEQLHEVETFARAGLGIDPYSAQLRYALGVAALARGGREEARYQLGLASALQPDWDAPQGILKGIAGGAGSVSDIHTESQVAKLRPQ